MTSCAKSNDSEDSSTLCMESKITQEVYINYEEQN